MVQAVNYRSYSVILGELITTSMHTATKKHTSVAAEVIFEMDSTLKHHRIVQFYAPPSLCIITFQSILKGQRAMTHLSIP